MAGTLVVYLYYAEGWADVSRQADGTATRLQAVGRRVTELATGGTVWR
jgi:hypothetical protein